MSAEIDCYSQAGFAESNRLYLHIVVPVGEKRRMRTPVAKVVEVSCDLNNTQSTIYEFDILRLKRRGLWDWLTNRKTPVYGNPRQIILKDGETYSLKGHPGLMSYVEEGLTITHCSDH